MRKIIISLLALMATTAMAQAETSLSGEPRKVQLANGELKCDSIITYNADGSVRAKEIMKYDAAGHITFRETYTRGDDGKLYGFNKFERAYNDDNKLTEEVSYFWENDSWHKNSRVEHSYDGTTETALALKWVDESWVNSQKFVYTYNNQDKKVLELSFLFKDGSWMEKYKIASDYDENGNQTLYETYRFENGSWVGETKKENAYTQDSKMTLEANYTWRNGWEPKDKREISYNEDGNIILDVSSTFYYDSNVIATTAYEYNTQGLVALITKTSQYPNSTPETYYKEEMTYDEYSNLLKEDEYSLHGTGWSHVRTTEYEYDKKNNMTQKVLYEFHNNDEIKIGKSKMVYEYDDHNRMTLSGEYMWKDEDWAAMKILGYAFDDEDRMIMESRLYYFEGIFQRGLKYENEFNELGKQTKELDYSYINDEWVCTAIKDKTYDENGNPLEFCIYVIDNGVKTLESTMVYYYLPDANKIESLSAASTPARIYNLNGQQVGKNYKGIIISNGKKHLLR